MRNMPFVWVRLGDADTYNRFGDLAEAAEYIVLFGVKNIWRCQRFGVESQGLTGQNYITLFFGDGDAQPTRDLSAKNLRFINERLQQEAQR